MLLVLALVACDGNGASEDARIDTTALWVGTEGRFHQYRFGGAGALDGGTDTASVGDVPLNWLWEKGGCADGEGWRVVMRVGSSWADGEGWGALHFSDAGDGLAVCGAEEPGGELVSLDPAVVLWTSEPRYDGEIVSSGDWQAVARVESDLSTYFGVFPRAVAFKAIGGSTRPDGWEIHFAPDVGPVLVQGPDFTADVMYFR